MDSIMIILASVFKIVFTSILYITISLMIILIIILIINSCFNIPWYKLYKYRVLYIEEKSYYRVEEKTIIYGWRDINISKKNVNGYESKECNIFLNKDLAIDYITRCKQCRKEKYDRYCLSNKKVIVYKT